MCAQARPFLHFLSLRGALVNLHCEVVLPALAAGDLIPLEILSEMVLCCLCCCCSSYWSRAEDYLALRPGLLPNPVQGFLVECTPAMTCLPQLGSA